MLPHVRVDTVATVGARDEAHRELLDDVTSGDLGREAPRRPWDDDAVLEAREHGNKRSEAWLLKAQHLLECAQRIRSFCGVGIGQLHKSCGGV